MASPLLDWKSAGRPSNSGVGDTERQLGRSRGFFRGCGCRHRFRRFRLSSESRKRNCTCGQHQCQQKRNCFLNFLQIAFLLSENSLLYVKIPYHLVGDHGHRKSPIQKNRAFMERKEYFVFEALLMGILCHYITASRAGPFVRSRDINDPVGAIIIRTTAFRILVLQSPVSTNIHAFCRSLRFVAVPAALLADKLVFAPVPHLVSMLVYPCMSMLCNRRLCRRRCCGLGCRRVGGLGRRRLRPRKAGGGRDKFCYI